MATVIDVVAPVGEFLDVYDETGITVGDGLMLQSKGGYVLVQYQAAAPADDSTEGFVLAPHEMFPVVGGEDGCWIRALNYEGAVAVMAVGA